MKTSKKWLVVAGILPLLALSGQAATVVLVNEMFADMSMGGSTQAGNGTYTSIDFGSRYNRSYFVNNGMEITRNAGNWQATLGQFQNNTGELSAIGDSVVVDMSFAFNGTLANNAAGFRIGLFNSNGTIYNATVNGGGSAAAGPGVNAPDGYVIGINPLAPSGTNQVQFYSHNNTATGVFNQGLEALGSAGLQAGASPTFGLGSIYSFQLSLTLVTAGSVEVSMTVKDSSLNTLLNYIVTDTGIVANTNGIVTLFDTIGFYNMGAAGQNLVDIHSITISQMTQIPEPATYAAVLGMLAVGGVMIWRRRR